MGFASSNLAVGTKAFAIVPSNTVNFAARARAFYVGVGGDVTVVNSDGTTCLFTGVGQGSIIPVECIRINSTGTTASGLVGLV